ELEQVVATTRPDDGLEVGGEGRARLGVEHVEEGGIDYRAEAHAEPRRPRGIPHPEVEALADLGIEPRALPTRAFHGGLDQVHADHLQARSGEMDREIARAAAHVQDRSRGWKLAKQRQEIRLRPAD